MARRAAVLRSLGRRHTAGSAFTRSRSHSHPAAPQPGGLHLGNLRTGFSCFHGRPDTALLVPAARAHARRGIHFHRGNPGGPPVPGCPTELAPSDILLVCVLRVSEFSVSWHGVCLSPQWTHRRAVHPRRRVRNAVLCLHADRLGAAQSSYELGIPENMGRLQACRHSRSVRENRPGQRVFRALLRSNRCLPDRAARTVHITRCALGLSAIHYLGSPSRQTSLQIPERRNRPGAHGNGLHFHPEAATS